MAERIDEATLTFPEGHIPRCFVGVGTSGPGGRKNAIDVVDSKHHLKRRPGRMLIDSKFTHDQLRTLAVDPELHAMGLAHPDVLDQAEHVDIPGGRCRHISDGKHRDHPRPRR